jgi:hypothetical protein
MLISHNVGKLENIDMLEQQGVYSNDTHHNDFLFQLTNIEKTFYMH